MAVLIGGISVIVAAATIEERYPGGLPSHAADCPNATFCTDGVLTRVGFMSPADTREFPPAIPAAHLADGEPGDLCVPAGWSYERCRLTDHTFTPLDELAGRFVPLWQREGVQASWDTERGCVAYRGRAFPFADEEPDGG